MAHPPSRLCLSDLRRSFPYKYWALMILDISPGYVAFYPLPVRQTSVLPSASFRFAVTHDTLAVRLALPLIGRAEDFHLLVSAPCRAHQKKTPHTLCGVFSIRTSLIPGVFAIKFYQKSKFHSYRQNQTNFSLRIESSFHVPCSRNNRDHILDPD